MEKGINYYVIFQYPSPKTFQLCFCYRRLERNIGGLCYHNRIVSFDFFQSILRDISRIDARNDVRHLYDQRRLDGYLFAEE